MATRNIKDAKDLSTGELIYFKGHAQATFMSDGRTVEEAVKSAYDLANGKQDKLVSGTNIKTINNTSILGSGNISISSYDDTELRNKITALEQSSQQGSASVSGEVLFFSSSSASIENNTLIL
jgi:hypothetical protein